MKTISLSIIPITLFFLRQALSDPVTQQYSIGHPVTVNIQSSSISVETYSSLPLSVRNSGYSGNGDSGGTTTKGGNSLQSLTNSSEIDIVSATQRSKNDSINSGVCSISSINGMTEAIFSCDSYLTTCISMTSGPRTTGIHTNYSSISAADSNFSSISHVSGSISSIPQNSNETITPPSNSTQSTLTSKILSVPQENVFITASSPTAIADSCPVLMSISDTTSSESTTESQSPVDNNNSTALRRDITNRSGNITKSDFNTTTSVDLNTSINRTILNSDNYQGNMSDIEEDTDTHFMSFEEWKKQKVGEDHQRERKLKSHENHKFSQKTINSNLNGAIGEDMEIDIGMFAPDMKTEEAGGKVYKDRFNYASFDCAATIVKTNSEAKGASSILIENKDSYLLNECSAPNKFVVIELCQDILVDTVLVGNYEFFSSTFKKIRLSVTDRFPTPANGWKILGEFEAENVRSLQTFSIKNPLIWARYLRLEVLSHYGSEYYCPISVLRVHGKTMMEEFKFEEEKEVEEIQKITENLEVENFVPPQAPNSAATNDLKSTETETFNEKIRTADENSTITAALNENVVDVERINTLNEECSVVLPYLVMDQFLEELYHDEYCQENSTNITESSATTSSPIETSIQEPTTQESIYKNIVKRLALLESNATLSLLYIEEQSKLLSNAFTKLEKRQTAKFDLLVSAFNTSIHHQIEQLTNLYKSLQEEANTLLATQSFAHQELLSDSSTKIKNLTSELTFQKRLSIFNTLFIVVLMVYVIATRDTFIETEYIEDENGRWHDLRSSLPSSPDEQYSPAGSMENIEVFRQFSNSSLKRKKKKIKFSVSHILSGTHSGTNTGSFFYDPNDFVYSSEYNNNSEEALTNNNAFRNHSLVSSEPSNDGESPNLKNYKDFKGASAEDEDDNDDSKDENNYNDDSNKEDSNSNADNGISTDDESVVLHTLES